MGIQCTSCTSPKSKTVWASLYTPSKDPHAFAPALQSRIQHYLIRERVRIVRRYRWDVILISIRRIHDLQRRLPQG